MFLDWGIFLIRDMLEGQWLLEGERKTFPQLSIHRFLSENAHEEVEYDEQYDAVSQ
jgi:hypothetical protein